MTIKVQLVFYVPVSVIDKAGRMFLVKTNVQEEDDEEECSVVERICYKKMYIYIFFVLFAIYLFYYIFSPPSQHYVMKRELQ